jgi:hypothetical protein
MDVIPLHSVIQTGGHKGGYLRSMEERTEFLEDIYYRLDQAQATQKKNYDKSHSDVLIKSGIVSSFGFISTSQHPCRRRSPAS